MFLHELPKVKELFEATAEAMSNIPKKIFPDIVEKDYWLMHCLWGLQQQGYRFELKGGTSLSRGFDLIDRFSEDIDIQIHPALQEKLPTSKNHDKKKHINARADYFDRIADSLSIPGLTFERDYEFDDEKLRSAGIRGKYDTHFKELSDETLKPGILLELGFDQTTPNTLCNISSWAYDHIATLNLEITNNRAMNVLCYNPEYTFVEKLQTISTKFRRYQEDKSLPINFLRHYYDVYKLFEASQVKNFIGTEEYTKHKDKRFRNSDEKDLTKNVAFTIPDQATRRLFSNEFEKKSAMYFFNQPSFGDILKRMENHLNSL